MANKAERIMVADFIDVVERIEKFAERANVDNDHYKRLQEDYNKQRRNLKNAFDTQTI